MNYWMPFVLTLTVACAAGGSDKKDDTDTTETDTTSTDKDSKDDAKDDAKDDEDTDGDTDDAVENPDQIDGGGFEDGSLAEGESNFAEETTTVDGWTFTVTANGDGSSANAGTIRPSAAVFTQVEPLAAPAEGNNAVGIQLVAPTIASASLAGGLPASGPVIGMIRNDNLETAAALTSYTVTVAVGNPLDSTFTEAWLYLSVNTQPAQIVVPVGDIPKGGWRDISVTLDPDDLFAGEPIYMSMQIRHTFVEGQATTAAGYFDNVRVVRTTTAADSGIWKPK